MSAPLLELQAAIVAAVNATATLSPLITGIFDRVPKDPWGQQEGYISFGPADTELDEEACPPLETVSMQLNVWSRKTGRVHAAEILTQLQRISRNLQTVAHPIRARSDPFVQIRADPDGLTTHGILRCEWTCEIPEPI